VRKVFTAAHSPEELQWGCNDNTKLSPSPPKKRRSNNSKKGRYKYIQMELANEGDTEGLLKRQPDELLPTNVARALLFQISFSIYAAANKFSVRHYDVKLLNIFLQRVETDGHDLVMRYGLGPHIIALRMPWSHAFVAKLADFGTVNIDPAADGLPVGIAHFTTLENTPPEFLILGDAATQGHQHDRFGLGLSMLQLFTGSRPYEEILEKVKCPPIFKGQLKKIWEGRSSRGYSVIRSVIRKGVKDGDPPEIFYDTLYRFLVLFGIPNDHFQQDTCPRVWKAITYSLKLKKRGRRGETIVQNSDVMQYNEDCQKFSIRSGDDKFIARARDSLTLIKGGLDLLFGLCEFDPEHRLAAKDVLTSPFMEELREEPGAAASYNDARVFSYTSFCDDKLTA
jgi:serine/threonine protein kinase